MMRAGCARSPSRNPTHRPAGLRAGRTRASSGFRQPGRKLRRPSSESEPARRAQGWAPSPGFLRGRLQRQLASRSLMDLPARPNAIEATETEPWSRFQLRVDLAAQGCFRALVREILIGCGILANQSGPSYRTNGLRV